MTFIVSILAYWLSFCTQPVFVSDCQKPILSDTLKVWPVMADRISGDPLGQFYIVRSGTIVKYDVMGDSAYSWSDPQTGSITMIDTGDPMRTLVYQKDFNLLRFLNNRLTPIAGVTRLDDLGIPFPIALATSRQGGFWVLSGSTLSIRLVSPQLNTVVESAAINLPQTTDFEGYRLVESGDQLFLFIPGHEILVFDLFANLVKKIPLKALSFQVYGNRILLIYPDRVILWKDPVTPEETIFQRASANIRDAYFSNNHLLIRTSDKVVLMIPEKTQGLAP
jgi:hypothetical protein